MVIIGIDPGKSGGIARLADDECCTCKMPDTERDLWDTLSALSHEGVKAYIEQVHAMPKQGVSSTWVFGQNYGGLRMALIAAGIPFEAVSPAKWQKALGCMSRGDKNVTKRRAQELFPSLKITHAVADALLIAEYGRRREAITI